MRLSARSLAWAALAAVVALWVLTNADWRFGPEDEQTAPRTVYHVPQAVELKDRREVRGP
jgi:hypothetical protein